MRPLPILKKTGWGQGGEMTQALYAHMNNKRKKKGIDQYYRSSEKGRSTQEVNIYQAAM
jgi:hypothetical protein